MGDKTRIHWTDATWNPTVGCSPVSEGCRNCYAARDALRLGANPKTPNYKGLATKTADGRPVFTGEVRCLEDRLDQPLRWKRPRRIFINSMSDLFHEAVPDEFIDRVFAVMAICPQHVFQLLTKRPERMRDYLSSNDTAVRVLKFLAGFLDGLPVRPKLIWHADDGMDGLRQPNVWLGVSVENQETANERIPHLLNTPAAVRWLSVEPLLAPVNLHPWLDGVSDTIPEEVVSVADRVGATAPELEALHRFLAQQTIDWVVVGGESGPRARPMDVGWARDIVDQCKAAGVPVFVKQMGRWIAGFDGDNFKTSGFHFLDRWLLDNGHIFVPPIIGPHVFTRPQNAIAFSIGPKGSDPEHWPEDLRIREYPEPKP